MGKLTPKQEPFLQEYLVDLNMVPQRFETTFTKQKHSVEVDLTLTNA